MDFKIFENHCLRAYYQNHRVAVAQEGERHRVSVEVCFSKTEPQIAPDEQVCALHGFLLHQCVSECSILRRKVHDAVWVENEGGMILCSHELGLVFIYCFFLYCNLV